MMLNFNSYEDLKDKLQIRIYDPDFSRNLLEGKVVTHIGDFALIYMATLYESEKKLGNLMFTPELMDALGIDIQTLHRDAMISDMNYEPVLFTTEDLIEAFALKKPLFSINLFNRKARMRGDKLPMPNRYKRRENDSEERLNKLLTAIFAICDASDFHIEERIVVKDKRTGKIWR